MYGESNPVSLYNSNSPFDAYLKWYLTLNTIDPTCLLEQNHKL